MRFSKSRRAIALVAVSILFSVAASAQIIAIKAGKLVDPETGTASVNQLIPVEKGRIKSVGAGFTFR